MRAQLDRISAVAGSVTIGVIPFATELSGWHDHAFTILDDRGGEKDPIVHIETLTTPLNVTDPEDVAVYRDAFGRLRAAAVTGEEARRLVAAAAAGLGEAG